MKKILVACIVVFIVGEASAQVMTPAQTLRLARSTYEQGRLHELPGLLEPNIGRFSQSEKVEAYKILALTYIYLEEPEKADAVMLSLLRTDNEFKPNKDVDPAEFIALYKTFRTDPVYRFGGKAGANVTSPNVVSSDNVTDGTSKYSTGFGFSVGVSAEIPVTLFNVRKHFTLNPELYFQVTSFNYKNSDSVRTNNGPRSHTWASLPISLQYSFGKSDDLDRNKFNPYVALGIETSYLLAASTTGQAKIAHNSGVEQKSFPVLGDLNRVNLSGILSAGIKYKIGKGVLVAEARYHQGLTNVTRKDGTFANSFLTWDHHATDAIYKLNYMSVTVGYLLNIYNPKKLIIKK
jgi:Outer membrane protein beta-barrel domain